MYRTLTDWRRAVCGGSRTAQNARRTCAVRIAQKWGGGGHFREKSALEAAFSALHAILGGGWPRWAAAPSFRAFQQRKISPCGVQGQIFHQKFRPAACRDKFSTKNFALRCAGTNFPPKISSCGVQGQIFHQKFRPAVCRDKFFTKNFVLRCAGTNFPPTISPCGVQGQIFHQKFRPAVCMDKFFTKNFALRCAGTNFSPKISPCGVQGWNFGGKERQFL